ncbi:uncharacterized protein B0H18DRAFT_1081338 [Fomitopsis serialis]|uniref:uncharacterized protein n=1 Tax=Fomitopsis serialis TaxID=139415 RepID=UPI002007520B|nr:uncharacterized protein B0H18DRAFT_1081338 [Neoantrodia serialis]KAH9937044.1 hypothetical protein B0H18DRAFT_1081338 [Neoantrodia serialis]
MSTAAGPSAVRGDITLQPSYFTSSLYYVETWPPTQPFALFKRLWSDQGWCWLHLKVLDARARETFVNVTERLFIERLADGEPLLARVVVLFALYAFHLSQPTAQNPPVHSVGHIAIPLDIYNALLLLPSSLTDPELLPLQPYAIYVLKTLEDAKAFHILPQAGLRPYTPSVLPRELFVTEEQESAIMAALGGSASTPGASGVSKKKGRPSRRDKQKKAKDALAALEKYLEKNTTTLALEATPTSQSAAADRPHTTHRMVAHPPSTTREQYRLHKVEALEWLDANDEPTRDVNAGREALQRANEAVLARLKMIDEMAAEQGLEVGGEGGEKTGLARVERAVHELLSSGSSTGSVGILGLLEGAGLDARWEL